ncbi:unnamed protein product [Notodromas monacha]|uniref:Cytochrome b5 heme-binding domain-containing protein n=1 Tax=Notodromas monacha TaxID=399045 RepID=A0A7R9BNE5_9CRUS|nr:unnamed protein product [Notodromas monacha]CAG0918719.1 unnamed protein product [Notodromas monacha]
MPPLILLASSSERGTKQAPLRHVGTRREPCSAYSQRRTSSGEKVAFQGASPVDKSQILHHQEVLFLPPKCVRSKPYEKLLAELHSAVIYSINSRESELMDSLTNSFLAGMNLRNQIFSLAFNSLKAAAETIGLNHQPNNNNVVGNTNNTDSFCPVISSAQVPRPTDCTPIEDLPVISMDTVAEHYHDDDCWVILYDLIYDITDFIREHPGGAEVLLEHAGCDATMAFRGVGHSKQALLSMDKMVVGVLPEEERLYLKSRKEPATIPASIWSELGLIELQSAL